MLRHEQMKASEINTQKSSNENKNAEVLQGKALQEKPGDQKISQNNNVIHQEAKAQKRKPVLGESKVTADKETHGKRSFNYPEQGYSNCFACAGSVNFSDTASIPSTCRRTWWYFSF